MAFDPDLSSVTVAYFEADRTPITVGTAEADGSEFALLTATILDSGSTPVPNAQVTFVLDVATPDRTARFDHGTELPDGSNATSVTDASGVATVIVRSQNSLASPLTVLVRVGEDTGKINGAAPPSLSTVGGNGTYTTTLGATTITEDGTLYENTEFTGQVTVSANGVRFFNCGFTGGGSNLISRNRVGTRVEQCRFSGSNTQAITGWGLDIVRCSFTDVGGSALFAQSVQNPSLTTRLTDCYIEKVAGVSAAPAILCSPLSFVEITGCKIYTPHLSSANGVAGYDPTSVIRFETTRPEQSSNIKIEGCWLYGGDDYVLRFLATDSGNAPAGVTLLNNRIGDPADYANPGGMGELVQGLPDCALIAFGNMDDATAALLSEINDSPGYGWLYPSAYITDTASLTFETETIPEATLAPLDATPPVATAIDAFSQIVHIVTPTAILAPPDYAAAGLGLVPEDAGGQINEGADAELGETEAAEPVIEGTGTISSAVDPYRSGVPTARLYRPKRKGTTVQPTATEVQFALNDVSRNVDESVGTVSLTLELLNAIDRDLTVGVTYTGTAVDDADFTAPDTVVISEGNTSGELEISITDDGAFEGTETITITISDGDGALIGERSSSTVRILDIVDEAGDVLAYPTVFFEQTVATVAESAGTVLIPVTMDRAHPTDSVTVNYSITTGTLAAGSDYTDDTAGSIVIPATQLSADIEITVIDDDTIETTEAMLIEIDSVSGLFNLGSETTFLLRVTDNDFSTEVEVNFLQATSSTLENAERTIRVALSGPADGAITVPFTLTEGTGLTSGDYDLEDQFGNALTSPISFVDGQSDFEIRFKPNDDTSPESDETLTITLGTPTGNCVRGALFEHVATIRDNDTSGAGADGDLYGLVPERQTVDFTSWDYDIYPDRYERLENVALGITATTVADGNGDYLARAVRDSYLHWAQRNAGNISTLQTSLCVEGEVVKFRINGDCVGEGCAWGQKSSRNDRATWEAYGRPVCRDIVIFGATGPDTDILGAQGVTFKREANLTTGEYAGRVRTFDNVRYERLSIEGNKGYQRCIGGDGDSNPLPEEVSGRMKVYDCWFLDDRDEPPGAVKWTVRNLPVRMSYDFRGNRAALTKEHFLYINSPYGGCYVVGNGGPPGDPRGGNGRTFCQIVSRRNDQTSNPLPPGVIFGEGDVVFMRNVIWDTASGTNQQGGGDLTIQGHNGDAYFVENEHLGLANPSSGGRAAITVWSASSHAEGGQSANMSPSLDFDGYEYAVPAVYIWGMYCAPENGTKRDFVEISCTREVEVRGFNMAGNFTREQFYWDKVGEGYTNSVRHIMGEPSRNGTYTHGVTWNLHWPTWNGDPWTGTVSQYPGWTGTIKMKNDRARRLANFDSEKHTLSNAQLDAYDGTSQWDGTRKPESGWSIDGADTSVAGVPVGAPVLVKGIHRTFSRSIRPQTWTYRRQLENYASNLFTETVSDFVSPAGGGGSGTCSFTLLDDTTNVFDDGGVDGCPTWYISNTLAPPNTAEPGIIRYFYDDLGSNAVSGTIQQMDVYVYDVNALGVTEWDTIRYGFPATLEFDTNSGEDNIFVYMTRTPADNTPADVNISIDPSTVWTPDPDFDDDPPINNYQRSYAPGGSEARARIINLQLAQPGDKVVVNIDTVTYLDAYTCGSVGANSQITINCV